jgi:hypothetical protein
MIMWKRANNEHIEVIPVDYESEPSGGYPYFIDIEGERAYVGSTTGFHADLVHAIQDQYDPEFYKWADPIRFTGVMRDALYSEEVPAGDVVTAMEALVQAKPQFRRFSSNEYELVDLTGGPIGDIGHDA